MDDDDSQDEMINHNTSHSKGKRTAVWVISGKVFINHILFLFFSKITHQIIKTYTKALYLMSLFLDDSDDGEEESEEGESNSGEDDGEEEEDEEQEANEDDDGINAIVHLCYQRLIYCVILCNQSTNSDQMKKKRNIQRPKMELLGKLLLDWQR